MLCSVIKWKISIIFQISLYFATAHFNISVCDIFDLVFEKGGEKVGYAKYMGRVIKSLRLSKELSQIEVAAKADVNLSYYCKIERGEGNPSVKKLMAILSTLGISPAKFWELVDLEQQYIYTFPGASQNSIT